MADQNSSKSKPNHIDPAEIVGTSAVAHVGRTLESDPEFNEIPGRAESIPERGLISRGGNDLTASPDMRAGSDPLVGTEMSVTGERIEPLKTRLPGDTSSDPHTDVGPDNASTVQDRGEK